MLESLAGHPPQRLMSNERIARSLRVTPVDISFSLSLSLSHPHTQQQTCIQPRRIDFSDFTPSQYFEFSRYFLSTLSLSLDVVNTSRKKYREKGTRTGPNQQIFRRSSIFRFPSRCLCSADSLSRTTSTSISRSTRILPSLSNPHGSLSLVSKQQLALSRALSKSTKSIRARSLRSSPQLA